MNPTSVFEGIAHHVVQMYQMDEMFNGLMFPFMEREEKLKCS